jgi:thiol-disulfide isomerase/thioredoxin
MTVSASEPKSISEVAARLDSPGRGRAFGRSNKLRRLIRFDAPQKVASSFKPPRRRSWAIRGLAALLAIAGVFWWVLNHRGPTLTRRPGQLVAEFSLLDVRTRQMSGIADHEGSVLVIVFVGTTCPVGDLYMPRLNSLAREYEPRRVDFVAINSNDSESVEDVAEYARRSRAIFPFLKDPGNVVADQLLAERTCEALVIDGSGRLRYRGAIDDQYGLGSRRDSPAREYLTDAIEAVIAGRNVTTEMTQVVGCPIERKTPRKAGAPFRTAGSPEKKRDQDGRQQPSLAAAAGTERAVTYADIAPILHNRCASCHRQGQVAPFSLLTYEQARRWSSSIDEVIADRRMPPWHADPRFGHFANDRSLTERERSLLNAWIDAGTPPGDLATAPVPPKYPQGWSIGTPDIVYEMPEPFLVPAEGTVPIQHFRVKTNLTQPLYIQAAEARPGDRAIVHHICIYIDDYNKEPGDGPRDKNLLVAYTPGDMPSVYAPGIAKKIAPGVDLTFEVHYTPVGQVRFDRTTVGVILAKERPRHAAKTRGISGLDLRIPAGAADHVARAARTFHRDIHLLSMAPHMHLRGKSFTYTAYFPDGTSEILLSVPKYDFNWQSVYRLSEPKLLPAGTTLECKAHFDNSAANPANPNPGKTVVWGEQTWDEMLIGFIDYYEDRPIRAGSFPR